MTCRCNRTACRCGIKFWPVTGRRKTKRYDLSQNVASHCRVSLRIVEYRFALSSVASYYRVSLRIYGCHSVKVRKRSRHFINIASCCRVSYRIVKCCIVLSRVMVCISAHPDTRHCEATRKVTIRQREVTMREREVTLDNTRRHSTTRSDIFKCRPF
jgi:hypothetical protein